MWNLAIIIENLLSNRNRHIGVPEALLSFCVILIEKIKITPHIQGEILSLESLNRLLAKQDLNCLNLPRY